MNSTALDFNLAAAGGHAEEARNQPPGFRESSPGWPLGQAPVNLCPRHKHIPLSPLRGGGGICPMCFLVVPR